LTAAQGCAGWTPDAERFIDHLNRWVSGIEVLGVFDDPDRELSSVICGNAVHGKTADLCEMCCKAPVEKIYLTTRPDESPEQINVIRVVASCAGRLNGKRDQRPSVGHPDGLSSMDGGDPRPPTYKSFTTRTFKST
jgi:hypothetical protein